MAEKFDARRYQAKLLKFVIQQANTRDVEIGNKPEAWELFLERAKASFYSRLNNPRSGDVQLHDFEFVNHIGKGSYGEVLLAMKKDTEEFFAVKIMNKIKIIEQDQISHAKQEKQIASSIRFQFTACMQFFFQTDVNIFFVLQLVLGKSLYEIADKNRLSESVVRFIAMQIVLGLEYLHYVGIIYRDLKLENIVMDQTGYVKIIDFGFAKILNGRTYTVCGTPEYMAPELIEHKGYGFAVDWWAFGVTIYELCAGQTPFKADIVSVVFSKIQQCSYLMPSFFSDELKELVDHLLTADITKRYGYIHPGVERIKTHSWFEDVSWHDILNKAVNAPIQCDSLHLAATMSYSDFCDNEPVQLEDKYVKMFENF